MVQDNDLVQEDSGPRWLKKTYAEGVQIPPFDLLHVLISFLCWREVLVLVVLRNSYLDPVMPNQRHVVSLALLGSYDVVVLKDMHKLP